MTFFEHFMYGAVFKQKSDNAKHKIIISHLGMGITDKQAKENAKHRNTIDNIEDYGKSLFSHF
ncbi:MAG: hypothetical protein PUE46_07800 [Eubacteriales bacterium]|nr:hypothetical protein [Eubacteriales bacterium]